MQGQPVTFTALVAVTAPGAGTPTGTVTFFDGGTSLGTGQLTVVGGKYQATFRTSSLAVGARTITAGYGGDGSFLASTSAALTQHVTTNLSRYPKQANGAYNLRTADLSGGYFAGAKLAGANLAGANLTNAVLTGADLTGANLAGASLNGANLSDGTFTGANLTGANLAGANLSRGTFTGAKFAGANLHGANLGESNLKTATGLKTAALSNVVWAQTQCPDGTNSSQNGGTCVGHL
jgi:uncharacterized protein YjbI with pentapeptide repeats